MNFVDSAIHAEFFSGPRSAKHTSESIPGASLAAIGDPGGVHGAEVEVHEAEVGLQQANVAIQNALASS